MDELKHFRRILSGNVQIVHHIIAHLSGTRDLQHNQSAAFHLGSLRVDGGSGGIRSSSSDAESPSISTSSVNLNNFIRTERFRMHPLKNVEQFVSDWKRY